MKYVFEAPTTVSAIAAISAVPAISPIPSISSVQSSHFHSPLFAKVVRMSLVGYGRSIIEEFFGFF